MQYSFKAALALFLHTNMLSVTLRLSAKKIIIEQPCARLFQFLQLIRITQSFA